MAHGKATVATRVGAVGDAVQHEETGLLVPPSDPDALAGAILRLLESPDERSRMGECGREYVARFFSERRMVEEVLQLYRELVS
jgi:glycosyltransferase involved in cell wall biosynthesis